MNKELVKCVICGIERENLGPHIRKTHGIKGQDYKKIYNAEITSNTYENKCKHNIPRIGELNHFFGKKHDELGVAKNSLKKRKIDFNGLSAEEIISLYRKVHEDLKCYCLVCGIEVGQGSDRCSKHRCDHLKGDNNPSKRIEVRKKIKDALALNPDRIKNVMRSSRKFPNKKESKLIEILNDLFPGVYRLNGGDVEPVMIGNRHPDIISNDGKVAIELFGDYWHDPKVFPDILTEAERIEYFKKFNVTLLIIWESELHNENLLRFKLAAIHLPNSLQEACV